MCHYLSQGTFPWPEEPLPDHVRVCVVIKIYTTWEFAPNITNLQRKSPNSCCRTFGLPMTKPSPTAPQIIKYGLSKSCHPSHWFDISSAWSLFQRHSRCARVWGMLVYSRSWKDVRKPGKPQPEPAPLVGLGRVTTLDDWLPESGSGAHTTQRVAQEQGQPHKLLFKPQRVRNTPAHAAVLLVGHKATPNFKC